MKKLLFGITSLTIGGAERVLVDLANRLVQEYDITIFTIYAGGPLEKELDERIHLVSLYDKQYSEFSKIEKIKISLRLIFKDKIPEGYNDVIAFLEGPITRLFSKKYAKHVKKIAWVHTDISKIWGKGFKASIKKYIDAKIYKKYNTVVFVSNELLKNFNKKNINTYGQKRIAIKNYLDYEKVILKSKENTDIEFSKKDINLVTVCRLVEAKGLDRYIRIHKKLEDEGYHSKVYIVGDGPLRYDLQKQIDKANETENFFLIGARENPYPYIKSADYFCLFSYFEGYGMVVDEAKTLGKRILISRTSAVECVAGYEKAKIFENTEQGIFNGLKEVLNNKDNSKNEILDEKQIIRDYIPCYRKSDGVIGLYDRVENKLEIQKIIMKK